VSITGQSKPDVRAGEESMKRSGSLAGQQTMRNRTPSPADRMAVTERACASVNSGTTRTASARDDYEVRILRLECDAHAKAGGQACIHRRCNRDFLRGGDRVSVIVTPWPQTGSRPSPSCCGENPVCLQIVHDRAKAGG
jgi:hypothetical protein